MTKDKVKRLKINLVQFVIGAILLSIVYVYLNANPAERTSLLSGPQVLVHKSKIFYHKIFSENGKYLAEKYELVRTFDEFISIAESTRCLGKESFEKLKQKQKDLKDISVKKYMENRKEYMKFASDYSKIMKEDCKR